ncbi:MAG: PAS domain S-box protein [Planctomycetes bacterium]|nr:PAS domain S-box protein [Planctomycetota bacterium]
MARRFHRSLTLAVGGLAAMLVLNAGLCYRNTRDLDERAGWVAHTLEVEEALADLKTTVTNAETSQRAYLVTGDASFLVHFQAAAGTVKDKIDRVALLTEDNPSQQDRLPRLRQLAQARLDELAAAQAVRQKQGFEAARQAMLRGEGRGTRDAFLTLVGEMVQEEKDLLRDRQARTGRTYQTAVLTGFLAAFFGLVALGVVVWLGRRFLAARLRAAAQLQQERERLRVSLLSIGDAVIATDPEGRVSFLNPTAQALTGWKEEEARGQPLATVFPIFHERTRQPVPNPVARVLREGAVVGLANHTVLRAKDGTERPVEDSAAPIRMDDGRIVGVILVFRDVSERRRQALALRQTEEQFRTLANTIPQLAWTARPDGHIFWYNQRWYEYTGTNPEQMAGWGWQAVHDPEELPHVLDRWKESLATGEPFDMVFPLKGKDGVFRPFLTRIVPLRGEDGRILQWFGTNTDISAIKEMEEKLREADRRKDQFVMMLAHELRNPLAPIRNSLQLLQASEADQPMVEQARRIMERQIGHLGRIIEDLLDVSRLMRGRVELRAQRLDLSRFVRTVLEDQRPAFDQAGLSLAADLSELPVWVNADPTRLTQVLDNLLQNAIKFTDRGGTIVVRVQAHEDRQQAVLTVRDTGVGIERDLLPHLFETFTQADRSLDRSKGGLGLGLSLVQGFVELHGGEVQAESAGPGQGAEFIIRLPLQPEPAAVTALPSAAPKSASRRLRVLVVEDNQDSADSLKMLLELFGYDVTVAYTGPSGVKAAKEWTPDVVLCDIGLPGLDGYGVARELRRYPATASTRMIAVTGYGGDEDRRRSREAGFDDHLVKPADPAELQELLATS